MASSSFASMTATQKARTTVYSYVRFSTGEQRRGRGKARQMGKAIEWCKANGFLLASTNAYADLGVSAFKSKNAETGDLKRFLVAVEERRVRPGSILLIESLDRLSRDSINLAVELLLSIINSEVIVVTIVDGTVYRADASPHELMGQLMMSVAIFMRSNDESRTKSDRKRDSWQAKREAAQNGHYHGGKLPAWLKVIGGKYQVIEPEAKKVRAIFKDYVEGSGLYRLKHKYGIPQATIGYWIDSPIVCGTLTLTEDGHKVMIENHYPAIIDKTTWKLAQHRRGERYIKRRAGRVGAHSNLFPSLITDPQGVKMEVSSHNGGTRNYVSKGYVIRCKYLEEVVCVRKLVGRFVTTREVEEVSKEEASKLAKIEASMQQLQAEMMNDPANVADWMPVMRRLQQQRAAFAKAPKIVRDVIDKSDIYKLITDENDLDARLKLREIARQSIESIKLKRIEGTNWHVLIEGVITTTDGKAVTFRYAYNTRRAGYIMLDEEPFISFKKGSGFFLKTAQSMIAKTLTNEVKAELAKLPTRRDAEASLSVE